MVAGIKDKDKDKQEVVVGTLDVGYGCHVS